MILITGAGGTVGTALVDTLKQTSTRFRVAHRDAKKLADARAAGLDAVAIDYDQPATIGPAVDGVEVLFLLGAGGRGQAEGETRVVEAAARAGVRKIVKLSVWAAAGEGYAFAKIHRQVERAIEASGMRWVHLRANGFMQNFVHHMADSIRAQGAFFNPAGDAAISHVDVRDIAEVARVALTSAAHDGEALELSGPRAFAYAEAAETLSRLLERPIRYVPTTEDASRGAMVGVGMPAFHAEYLLDLYRFYRGGAGAPVSDAVRRVLGRNPTPFETFARDHASAFR